MKPREVIARAIADNEGWLWDLMPSEGDHFTGGRSHAECRRGADAILVALDAAGLRVVPAEPTEAMLWHGASSMAERIYRAMLAAAAEDQL